MSSRILPCVLPLPASFFKVALPLGDYEAVKLVPVLTAGSKALKTLNGINVDHRTSADCSRIPLALFWGIR